MHRSQTSCEILLSLTDEVLNEEDALGVLETDSVIYNPSIASSGTSIVSYKTEKTVNSHTSHIAPRHKFAEIGRPRLPQGLVTEEVDDTSTLQVCRTISSQYSCNYLNITVQQSEFDEPFSSSRSITPTIPKAHFVEETRQILVTQSFDRSLDVNGSSVYGFSLVVRYTRVATQRKVPHRNIHRTRLRGSNVR
jgi:hypothetical protein